MKSLIKKSATLAFLAAATLSSVSALADPITVIAQVKVRPDAVEAFKAAAEEFVVPTRQEADNISYTFVQSSTDPTEFATIELWKTQAGIDAHMSSAHISVFFSKAGPLLEPGYPVIKQYSEFAK